MGVIHAVSFPAALDRTPTRLVVPSKAFSRRGTSTDSFAECDRSFSLGAEISVFVDGETRMARSTAFREEETCHRPLNSATYVVPRYMVATEAAANRDENRANKLMPGQVDRTTWKVLSRNNSIGDVNSRVTFVRSPTSARYLHFVVRNDLSIRGAVA